MNEKFYQLSEEKRQNIIDAGFRVFSEDSYRKSPVGEIARKAGISKSLLFFYFRNKKDLYLFLWREAIRVSIGELRELERIEAWEGKGYFSFLEDGMKKRLWLMEKHPNLSAFVLRAYYEKDPEVQGEIQASCKELLGDYNGPVLEQLKQEEFIPGLDLAMMCQEIYWASDGYLRMMTQDGSFDVEKIEAGFLKLIQFWKKIYLADPAEPTDADTVTNTRRKGEGER